MTTGKSQFDQRRKHHLCPFTPSRISFKKRPDIQNLEKPCPLSSCWLSAERGLKKSQNFEKTCLLSSCWLSAERGLKGDPKLWETLPSLLILTFCRTRAERDPKLWETLSSLLKLSFFRTRPEMDEKCALGLEMAVLKATINPCLSKDFVFTKRDRSPCWLTAII